MFDQISKLLSNFNQILKSQPTGGQFFFGKNGTEQIIFLQQAVNSPTQQEQVGPSGVGESNWAKVFSLNIPIQRESWSGCIF